MTWLRCGRRQRVLRSDAYVNSVD